MPRRWGLLAKDTSLRLFSLGAYVGEVVRRDAGGAWEGDDEDPEAELNLALRLPDDSVVWPVQRAIERMRNGAEDGIVAYAAALGVDVGEKPSRGKRRKRLSCNGTGTALPRISDRRAGAPRRRARGTPAPGRSPAARRAARRRSRRRA